MKVAICIPAHGTIPPVFAISLAQMMYETAKERSDVDLEIVAGCSSNLPYLRNNLVDKALKTGASHLLLLDADHAFPGDALLRLLAHNRPVVGLNQPTRSWPCAPTARALDGQLLYPSSNHGLERVKSIGLAMALIARSAIEAIQLHADAEGRAMWPLFKFGDPGPDALGEDIYFCELLAAAGVPIVVDNALSAETRHVLAYELSLQDALSQREAWDAKAHRA